MLLVVSVIALVAAAALGMDRGVLRDMANPAYARGLITFLFAVVTIGSALVLVVGGLIGANEVGDRQFQRGKEVLSLLLGVFGTILGYYFGSAHSASASTSPGPPIKGAEVRLGIAGRESNVNPISTSGELRLVLDCEFDQNISCMQIELPSKAAGFSKRRVATPDATRISLFVLYSTESQSEPLDRRQIFQAEYSPAVPVMERLQSRRHVKEVPRTAVSIIWVTDKNY